MILKLINIFKKDIISVVDNRGKREEKVNSFNDDFILFVLIIVLIILIIFL